MGVRAMTHTSGPWNEDELDVAIIGAGAAGTNLGYRLIQARPDWRIAILERSGRIGGRLWSVPVDGLSKPIELGGMRFMSGHVLVQSIVDELGIATRAFDPSNQPERTVLRGVLGGSADDPDGGRGYDLPPGEAGRSAADLLTDAFARIAPELRELDEVGWRRFRATATFRGRPITDWSIEEAVATILSPEGHRFVTDAFGYDSGIRPHNAGDAIQYLMGTGHPSGEARVPVDGMDRIPRELAAQFVARGGGVHLRAEVQRLDMGEGTALLELSDGTTIRARRVVLTIPIPALESLAARSPLIDGPVWRRLYHSNVGYSSVKLYAWYERPWWRDGAQAPSGLRTTTDLPIRKVFYFDEAPEGPAAILAAFTDFRYDEPIVALAKGASGGAAAPDGLLRELHGWLAAAHPGADVPARPSGSAIQRWGNDPREVGWHFWRAGSNSDEMLDLAVQPDPSLPIHIAGEVFSRAGAWVEGALTSARLVEARLLA